MSPAGWVSLVAMLGWLALVVSALRTHRIGGRRTLAMALAWAAIIALVALLVALYRADI